VASNGRKGDKSKLGRKERGFKRLRFERCADPNEPAVEKARKRGRLALFENLRERNSRGSKGRSLRWLNDLKKAPDKGEEELKKRVPAPRSQKRGVHLWGTKKNRRLRSLLQRKNRLQEYEKKEGQTNKNEVKP